MADSELHILSLFSGTGMLDEGLRLALQLIGMQSRVVGFCERDACAAALLLARMENQTLHPAPVWGGDIHEFDAAPWRGAVDAITGGYPCQPFSSAGKRLGRKDPRHLWPAVRRIVARVKPGIVFFENVDGHVTLGLWKVLRDLERLGYCVAPGVFSAKEVGAPHLRKRVFILGYSEEQHGRRREHDGGAYQQVECRRTGVQLGDSSSNGREQGRARTAGEQGRPDAASGSGRLADSECVTGCTEHKHDARERQGGSTANGPVHGTDSQRLAADNQPRLESGRPANGMPSGHGSPHFSVREFPVFPPGRDAYDQWARLAALGLDPSLMPAIESGFSVVADGLAPPADLLRLGGNGVVPVCAAWAFLNLLCCVVGVGAEEPESTGRVVQRDLF